MKLTKINGGFYFGIFLFIVSVLPAQDNENLSLDNITPNSQLALSNPDYLVTAGDIYTLAYTANGVAVTYVIMVDSSYTIRISNLGIIDVTGKTFRQLKRDAENIVARNYPLSGVQMILTQPGIFRVLVVGEVKVSAEISTWAMARLSSLTRYTTPFASIRNVSIKSANGRVKNYDLFKAEREGDLSQNPYLRPDDVITFNRLERQVTINGVVERPGVYQLLTKENLKDLIEKYARGFTPIADKTHMELVRYVESGSVSGDKILFTEADIQKNYPLQNYDVITIPSITDRRPAATLNRQERRITLNGAVRRPGTYELAPNENLKDLIEIYGDGLTPLADKTRMELIRYEGDELSRQRIFLKDSDIKENFELKNYDIVTIPDASEWWPITSPQKDTQLLESMGQNPTDFQAN